VKRESNVCPLFPVLFDNHVEEQHPSYESFHSHISKERNEMTRSNLAISSTGKRRKIP
jgi:hypothetical protein